VRLRRREDHVARTDQPNLSLIRVRAWWWPERPDQAEADAGRVVRIRLNLDDVPVEDDFLSCPKLVRGQRLPEHQAVGLLFFAHAGEGGPDPASLPISPPARVFAKTPPQAPLPAARI
jgi:hypothetical protein